MMTLRDLESQQPMMTQQGYGSRQQGAAQIDLGYTKVTVRPPLGFFEHICLCCCPCCLGNPFSAERKADTIKAFKSFTVVVSAVQIIMFIVELAISDGILPYSQNSSIGPDANAMIKVGAKFLPYIRLRGEIWRLFAPIFLHAGFLHLFFNLFAQIQIGLRYEFTWGLPKTVSIYLLSGIAGNILSCLGNPTSVGVGASGALLGWIGAQIAMMICTWGTTDRNTRNTNLFSMLFFLVIMLFLGSGSYVDNYAHLGGVLMGLMMGMFFFADEYSDPSVVRKVRLGAGVAVGVFFIITVPLMFTLCLNMFC
eukprot:GILJ01003756.1.p1 GENE.GILJ01003756.1~~GILJ01003756.1.p1  ORF type:complete len:348 (+),score=36.81 GILJ01003756.1:119-1045(+)